MPSYHAPDDRRWNTTDAKRTIFQFTEQRA
jgi:hypothetical protein